MNMQLSETINAPIGKVFDVFSDLHTADQRIEEIVNIEVLTDGPIGVGTRFRETRIMFGRESTEEMEITRFEPNKGYCVEADSCGAHFQTEFRFRENGDRTDVEMVTKTQAVSLFAKLMKPVSFLMAGTMKKCFESDIAQLKKYCEQ